MRYWLHAMRNGTKFGGRASRKEFWMFQLMNFIFSFSLEVLDGAYGISPAEVGSVLVFLYQVAVFVPSVSAAARRLHDCDRSGWWQIVPLVNIIMLCKSGDIGPNRFGDPPLALASLLTMDDTA